MPRMPVEERRAELIAAARTVLMRDGVAGASVRAIVREANMPLGAFHYVFESRDELLAEVVAQITDEAREAAWLEVDEQFGATTAAEMLQTGIEGYLHLLQRDPAREIALLDLAVHAIRNEPDSVRTQWQVYRHAAARSLDRIAELARIRWRRPVPEIAADLVVMLDGLTLSWLTGRDTEAALRTARMIATVIAADAVPSLTAPLNPTGGTNAHRHG